MPPVHRSRWLAWLGFAWLASGCGGADPGVHGADVVRHAEALAASYVDAYYTQFPEQAYEFAYDDAPTDRFSHRDRDAFARWWAAEDSLLSAARAIDPNAVRETSAAIPLAYLVDRLEASIGMRVCRMELWNLSPTWTGWQNQLADALAAQPVGTADRRAAVLARVADLARYLDTEIGNLRRGIAGSYLAPRTNAVAVLGQVDALIDLGPRASPFFEPAARDSAPGFADELLTVIDQITSPAIERYRDFLADEYVPAARDEPGVLANPDGRACYDASIRYFTSTTPSPEAIHEQGKRELARVEREIREIGRRSFGADAPEDVLRIARTDPAFTFHSREEVLAYAQDAVDRAREAVPGWFGFVPRARVVLRPYPSYQETTAPGGFYAAGSTDGSTPGTYMINTGQWSTRSKAGLQATAFHETYPGHHFQGYVALERGDVHPVLKHFTTSGTSEGWALYSERLAVEMGLYSSDIDRLGQLSNEAWRAVRMVVDPGMHILGWSRRQAIDYMLTHTAASEASATAEIDRYLAVPGQATSYMIGSLEIQRLRRSAEEQLGDAFDIRAFHDSLLEDGAVSLGMFADKIERWIAEQTAERRNAPAPRAGGAGG